MVNYINSSNKTNLTGKKLFYVAYFILLMRLLLLNSTLAQYLDVGSAFYRYFFRLIAYLLIAVKVLFFDRYSKKVLLVYVFLGVYFVISLFFNKYLMLLEIFILVIGSHGVELKSIVQEFFYVASVTCAMLFILSICGVIENHIAYAGDIPRYSFGNIYPTDFAASLFYIQLSHAYIRKKDYNFLTFAFWVLVAFFVLQFSRARLNFTLILCFAVVMYLKSLFPGIIKNSVIKKLIIWAVPVFCLLSIVLHYKYTADNAFLSWVDRALSGRLYYGNQAIEDYGFSLFGNYIKMQGWGFSLEEWDEKLGYYFVDCGWLSMALRFGVLFPIFLCISFMTVSKNAFKNKDYTLPIILLFLSVTSIVDHHVTEIGYNPFLIVLGVAINQIFTKKRFNNLDIKIKTKFYAIKK